MNYKKLIIITILMIMLFSGCQSNNKANDSFYFEKPLSGVFEDTSEITSEDMNNIEIDISTKNAITSSNIENSAITEESLTNDNSLETSNDSDLKNDRLRIIAVDDLLLGGYKNGCWMEPDEVAPQINGDEVYLMYDLHGYLGTGKGGTPVLDEEYGENYWVGLTGQTQNTVLIGNHTDVNFQKPKYLEDSIYVNIVNEFFRKEDLLGKYTINITQSISVDLDADGIDENIISLCRYNESDFLNSNYVANSNYSYLILSKSEADDTTISIIAEAYRYEVVEELKDHYKVEVGTKLVELDQFSIIGIVDINEDGVMDVIVRDDVWEGNIYSLYEYRNGVLQKVLEAGVGV